MTVIKNKSPEPSTGKNFPHIEMVGGVSKKSGKLQAWILQPSRPLCTENLHENTL